MDNKGTLEALRNAYLLQRNGNKKSIIVCINLFHIENWSNKADNYQSNVRRF